MWQYRKDRENIGEPAENESRVQAEVQELLESERPTPIQALGLIDKPMADGRYNLFSLSPQQIVKN
jgi:hypothetical protein